MGRNFLGVFRNWRYLSLTVVSERLKRASFAPILAFWAELAEGGGGGLGFEQRQKRQCIRPHNKNFAVRSKGQKMSPFFKKIRTALLAMQKPPHN